MSPYSMGSRVICEGSPYTWILNPTWAPHLSEVKRECSPFSFTWSRYTVLVELLFCFICYGSLVFSYLSFLLPFPISFSVLLSFCLYSVSFLIHRAFFSILIASVRPEIYSALKINKFCDFIKSGLRENYLINSREGTEDFTTKASYLVI